MIFKERALAKALESAFDVGYEIIPNGERMTICTEKWAIDTNRWDLPLKVNLKLIEHAGFIPNTPIKVEKGGNPQQLLNETANIHLDRASTGSGGEWQEAAKLPIIYKEHWQLYFAEDGSICAFDTDVLGILDGIAINKALLRTGYYTAGVFELGGNYLMLSPAALSPVDRERLTGIAALGWENIGTYGYGGDCENLSLFDMGGDED